MNGFQHQMVLDWDQAFPCLGIGQNGPHLAIGIMLLPGCGWCLWAPLQVTWRRSATVVSPDQEFRTPVTFENQKPDNFASTLSLSWNFDYFWPCPLLSITKGLFLIFTTPKRQAIYLIARAFGKNIGFVRRGVRLLVAPWRASSSQVNTKCSTLNVLGTRLVWLSGHVLFIWHRGKIKRYFQGDYEIQTGGI